MSVYETRSRHSGKMLACRVSARPYPSMGPLSDVCFPDAGRDAQRNWGQSPPCSTPAICNPQQPFQPAAIPLKFSGRLPLSLILTLLTNLHHLSVLWNDSHIPPVLGTPTLLCPVEFHSPFFTCAMTNPHRDQQLAAVAARFVLFLRFQRQHFLQGTCFTSA